MKGKLLIILSGVALLHLFLLGGLALTGGCSSDEEDILADKNYVPAPAQEASAPGTPAPALTEITPAPALTGPSAPSMTELPPINPVKSELVKYTVQKGDSLWKIAKMYGVGIDELSSYNQISSAKSLKVGQTLTIPPGGRLMEKGETAKSSAPKASKATASKTSVKSSAAAAPKKAAAPAADLPSDGTYTVQKGDSFAKIASKFHVKSADIAAANNMDINKMLQIGQKLVIPKAGATAATAKAGAAKKEAGETDSKSAAPAAAPTAPAVKTGDSLLDEIPSPDAAPAADAAKPLASSDVVGSIAKETAPAATPAALPSETVEIDQDSTVEAIAAKYGCKADEIKKLNPELPSDGKLKAGMVVKLP